ncbi:hypothetical protein PanWU01x14_108910 [Parasponia andersonii]|uniref:Uncharacterized protein n=1 Tax=Parasponia andersonii TaxID=3476 RepID=A0A2P5CZJ2_PARAD|nr:hypothetical protein PanWU01x14_108910 [Parasponia andersonii]
MVDWILNVPSWSPNFIRSAHQMQLFCFVFTLTSETCLLSSSNIDLSQNISWYPCNLIPGGGAHDLTGKRILRAANNSTLKIKICKEEIPFKPLIVKLQL